MKKFLFASILWISLGLLIYSLLEIGKRNISSSEKYKKPTIPSIHGFVEQFSNKFDGGGGGGASAYSGGVRGKMASGPKPNHFQKEKQALLEEGLGSGIAAAQNNEKTKENQKISPQPQPPPQPLLPAESLKVESCSLKEGSPAPEKMIVVARYREDVSWLPIYLGDIPFIVYSKSDPLSPFNVLPNLGQEVLPYLKFIVDHYERLPNYTAFIHAHRKAWHNNQDMAELLRNLYWGKYQYTPLNADQWHVISSHTFPDDLRHIRQAWPKIFQQELGDIPPQFTNHCCGQFVVSRERILAHPKQFYQKCFDWTASGDMETYWSSRVFEHTWSYIFGDEANPRQTISSYCDIAKVC